MNIFLNQMLFDGVWILNAWQGFRLISFTQILYDLSHVSLRLVSRHFSFMQYAFSLLLPSHLVHICVHVHVHVRVHTHVQERTHAHTHRGINIFVETTQHQITNTNALNQLNPQQGPIICKDSPKGRICVYTYWLEVRVGGDYYIKIEDSNICFYSLIQHAICFNNKQKML
jgi:hypothetical protein